MNARRYVCVLLGHDWTTFRTRVMWMSAWTTVETEKVCHRCGRTVVK